MKVKSWFAFGLFLATTVSYANTRLQVEGHGTTVEQAKQNGFRTAIEQVVGQVIVSDQEVSGSQLTKDWIGGYSAGYVDAFEILETHQEGNEVIVKMNVAVASSKIAQRMMSSGDHSLIIQGEQLQAQLDTQLEQRDQGDRLIAEVFSSYPHNAYIVNSGQTELGIGQRREVYIDVPYEIHWSHFWLEAIEEALGVIALDSKSCNSWWKQQDERIRLSAGQGLLGNLRDTPCGQESDMRLTYKKAGNWLSVTHSYYFYDRQTRDVINSQLRTPVGRQHIGLRVDLKNADGLTIDSRCAKIDTSLFVSYTNPQLEVISYNDLDRNVRSNINGDQSVYGTLRVHLHNKDIIGEVARVALTIEKTCN